MSKIISARVAALRGAMKQQGIEAVVIPSTDPHLSEYVPDHWKVREWISGFNGSAGTAVVTLDRAALWTDSRYFLQAGEQLADTEFTLMKERMPETPSISEWLSSVLPPHTAVGINGWTHSANDAKELRRELEATGHALRTDFVLPLDEWADRAPMPDDEAVEHPLCYAGVTCLQKIQKLRQELQARELQAMLIPTLDDIAWTLNIRGNDIHCNPVTVSYLIVSLNEVLWFVDPRKVPAETAHYLSNEGVTILPYEAVQEKLRPFADTPFWMDGSRTNYALYSILADSPKLYDREPLPVPYLKMVKNETEMEGFRRAMLRDGVAMVKFLKWLEEAVPAGGQTELSIDKQLYAFRAEQRLFKGISFDTIAGYKAHGAIVHYEATPETDIPLHAEGLLLLDSGAQYLDGTTDITRTMALGEPTAEEKYHYTIVLKAHIGLTVAKFPQGTCGTQLDALAHAKLWEEGLNYMHGTGHGVGSYLNVHEGPHQIRANYMPTPLQPGMTVTDEPGLYIAGRHGIRIENTLLVVPYKETEFGAFYQFEPLTLCPIDTKPIDTNLLTLAEVEWLNDYHRMVYERLAPHLDTAHLQWLAERTKEIHKS